MLTSQWSPTKQRRALKWAKHILRGVGDRSDEHVEYGNTIMAYRRPCTTEEEAHVKRPDVAMP